MLKKVMPFVAQGLSSGARKAVLRGRHEVSRRLARRAHELHVFVQISDPYSYLLMQALPEIKQRFDVDIKIHGVLAMEQDMYPDLERWRDNAVVDAERLAKLYGYRFPENHEPVSVAREHAFSARLLELEKSTSPIKSVLGLFDTYWEGLAQDDYCNEFDRDVFSANLAANENLRDKLGHYFAAMIYYAGEWYWGLDRLDHLERRLNHLGVNKETALVNFNRQYANLCHGTPDQVENHAKKFEIFFSARSPYSYLGLEKGAQLAQHYNIDYEIKPVLPMIMRGMKVPQTKKMYIFLDTKREAQKLGIPYGKVADPVGAGVERCYALFDYAKSEGKGLAFLLEYARAVNSQGVHADSDEGMKLIVERSELDWDKCRALLRSQDWRAWADQNQEELFAMGQWGVPCFRYGETVVWGQDRLWLIEDAILSSNEA